MQVVQLIEAGLSWFACHTLCGSGQISGARYLGIPEQVAHQLRSGLFSKVVIRQIYHSTGLYC